MELTNYMNSYQISRAEQFIAQKIRSFHQSKICFISIAKGGNYLLNRLLFNSEIAEPWKDVDIVFGHIRLSSYSNGTKSNKQVHLVTNPDLDPEDIDGKHVWIIDDCSDSGRTLDFAVHFMSKYAKVESINTIVLVDKVNCEKVQGVVKPTIVGIEYEGNGFLVGCGMGLGEKYRHLQELYELDPKSKRGNREHSFTFRNERDG